MGTNKLHFDKGLFNSLYVDKVFKALNRYQIVFGGSSSGKSVAIAQRHVLDLLNGGRNILSVRKTANTLRGSCFAEVVKFINTCDLRNYFVIKDGTMEITAKNKFSINFRGLDDVEKLKSFTPPYGVLTDIHIEEATEIPETDFDQLDKRLRGLTGGYSKRIVLSFNPILKSHWIFKRFFKTWLDLETFRDAEDLLILKSTYKDNKFLESDDIKALENTTDDYMREVYVKGNWGVLGGLIFTNTEVADVRNSPIFSTFDIRRYGLDFGFSNDPTAFNAMYYHRPTKNLFIFDDWNALGCTNDEIARELKLRVTDSGVVVCDSAEPKSIAELNNYGLKSRGAGKGKDSVKHGIQWLQQQNIIIDATCQTTINDFGGYQWKKDKHEGNINIPTDAFSHHPDAIRYACEDLVFDCSDIPIAGGKSKAA